MSATSASAMPRRSSRERPMTSARTETITAARPKYAAHGIKVSNEKRKSHHPRRHPIGPSAKSTTAIPANANASFGTCFRTDCRAVDEVVAIVMTCSSQAMQRREDRTSATRRCLADFRPRTGGPSGSTIALTAVDLRRRGVGWIASITSGGVSVKRLYTAAVGIADFDPLAAIQPNRAVWRPASVHCPALARLESFGLAGGLLLSKGNGHRPRRLRHGSIPRTLAFARPRLRLNLRAVCAARSIRAVDRVLSNPML